MLTNEQLQARKKGIGGSDAAAVCGLDIYRSPLDVFLEKTGQVESQDISHKNCIKYGNFFEDFVANLYAHERGVIVRKCNKTLVHPRYEWMIANIDRRVVGQKLVLECKTASVFGAKQWGEDDSDYIPDNYLMQVAHYAAVCDVPKVDVAVYFTDHRFKICTYNRNLKLEKQLIEIERNFWEEHVLKGNPPAAKNMDDIKRLFPETDNSALLASKELTEQIEDYKCVQEQMKELDKQLKGIKTAICSKMGLASVLQDAVGNKLATWGLRESSRLDTTRLKKEHPELYKQYCKKSASRYFTIKD